MTSTQQLADRWIELGIRSNGGLSAAEVSVLERDHSVDLPQDFRDYLIHLNGMDQTIPNAPDPNGFSIWPRADLKSLEQEYRKRASLAPVPDIEQYYVFADYLQWWWAYAIALAGPELGRIKIAGFESPVDVADKFEDFVQPYLADSPRLYGPTPRSLRKA